MPSHASPRIALIAGAAALGASLLTGAATAGAAEPARLMPPPVVDEAAPPPGAGRAESIVVSGGCFWGVQGVFEHLRGVDRAVAGYAGGAASTAAYGTVSTGVTGHAESVQITYDPAQITLGRVLQVFFSVALDPTEEGYQGPDFGSQYRSEVWVSSPAQRRIAAAYVAQLDQAHVFDLPIATRVDDLPAFYPAEPYHQDYLTLHPGKRYIAVNDIPKVEALERLFPQLYRAAPVTVLKQPAAS